MLLLLESLGLCSALGRSSFEVPFSLVLFCVAQAPSQGPSCGQELLSDVPLSAQSKQCLRLNRQLFGEQEPHSCSQLFLFSACVFLSV